MQLDRSSRHIDEEQLFSCNVRMEENVSKPKSRTDLSLKEEEGRKEEIKEWRDAEKRRELVVCEGER